jgi:hypothetical protein
MPPGAGSVSRSDKGGGVADSRHRRACPSPGACRGTSLRETHDEALRLFQPEAHVRGTSVSTRSSLLFLWQTMPYPPDSGVTIHSFRVLRFRARPFDVTVLCFSRREGEPFRNTTSPVDSPLRGGLAKARRSHASDAKRLAPGVGPRGAASCPGLEDRWSAARAQVSPQQGLEALDEWLADLTSRVLAPRCEKRPLKRAFW